MSPDGFEYVMLGRLLLLGIVWLILALAVLTVLCVRQYLRNRMVRRLSNLYSRLSYHSNVTYH